MGSAYLFYDLGWAYGLVGPGWAGLLEAAALHDHFARFSEGLVALPDVVYFVCLAGAAFGVARAALEWRRLTG